MSAPLRVLKESDSGAHDTEAERPLGGYAILTSVFLALAGAFALSIRRSGRTLPERVSPGDLVLLTLATHKVSRLITRERVTSTLRAPFTRHERDAGRAEVEERAVGSGLRRAIGELLICPYCLGLWVAAALTAGLILAPRATRWTATVFTVLLGSDILQVAYKKLDDTR